MVADTRSQTAAGVAEFYFAQLSSPETILSEACDILAPCALGGVMNAATVEQVQARLVCGAANNVLATHRDGVRLAERGVLYCPDYVVNSGGIINVCAEYLGWPVADVERRVAETGRRLAMVLEHAELYSLLPHDASDTLARAKIPSGYAQSTAAA